ncbi:hypothetical protein [Natronolimnohabitans innermongolicus]|uniref:Uncharacterized protein n=1 Tax=Natronolimnohabitans innermongolicus JCM 12255 TaxID=1227499 RepID=L9X2G4_9EURY|nr:hypothetical protein [Natronolimnohabitans innermongolicus]ELY55910.1 hypothetical protein C493_10543 [Natronolimnohabitans innermongolicus JCM 12255]
MSPPRRSDPTASPSDDAPASNASETATDARSDPVLSRRGFVAAGGTATLASLAGCASLVDFLADIALQDVNVFNGYESPVAGTIEIVGPDGETVLEESFDLAAATDDDDEADEDDETTAFYDDVWTDGGDYEVTVELEDDPEDDSSDENGETDDEGDDGDDPDSSTEESSEEDDPETDNDDGSPTDETMLGPSNTETVTIDDPEEERLVAGLAQDGPAELISFHVIEDFSDLEDEFE